MPTPLTPKAHPPLERLSIPQRILFTDARDRIIPPRQWTQGQLSDKHPLDPDATCWCASGTLVRTARGHTTVLWMLRTRLDLVVNRFLDDDRMNIVQINDDTIHQSELPEILRPLTPHQRVLFFYDEVIKS